MYGFTYHKPSMELIHHCIPAKNEFFGSHRTVINCKRGKMEHVIRNDGRRILSADTNRNRRLGLSVTDAHRPGKPLRHPCTKRVFQSRQRLQISAPRAKAFSYFFITLPALRNDRCADTVVTTGIIHLPLSYCFPDTTV
jgi:hypothetical protein